MRKLCLLLLMAAASAFAQVESAKVHLGDDSRWAEPGFDDSLWKSAFAPVIYRDHPLATTLWVRYQVRVPDLYRLPVLGIHASVAEIYVEGVLAKRHGRFLPDFQSVPLEYFTVPIPHESAIPGRVLTVSVRVAFPRSFAVRGLEVLPQLDVHRAGEEEQSKRGMEARKRGFIWAAGVAMLLLAIVASVGGGHWRTKDHTLLLAYLSLLAPFHSIILSAYFVPLALTPGISAFCRAGAHVVALEFLASTTGVRAGILLRVTQATIILGNVAFVFVTWLPDVPAWLAPVVLSYQYQAILAALMAVIILAQQKAGSFSSRLLPLGLTGTLVATATQRLAVASGISTTITVGDTAVSWITTGTLVMATVLTATLLLRLRKTGVANIRMEAQFAAARSVQEMLLGGGRQQTAEDYSLEMVYTPAEEVGGDFYRVLATPDGGTLVVVGDVSGKGLRAAMLVSVTVGALLNRRSNQPDEVLAELNNALAGQMEGGFVTCCAALLSPNGEVTVANAGHPSPYCGGLEVEVPGGLPLGLARDIAYESAGLRVKRGEQLTFVSDGVVEAANAQDELFGFERTSQISGKSAAEIAEAAKAWGQNDDITVVTVRRVA